MNATPKLEAKKFPVIRSISTLPTHTMEEHYEIYRDYVSKTNEILQKLARADRAATHPVYSEFRSLKKEFPVALAAVKSYELFLGALGPKQGNPLPLLDEQIRKTFGSYQNFVEETTATAMASRGWVALGYDPDLKTLVCLLGDTPEELTAWNVAPVLVMEVSERASGRDFERDRRRYVQALLQSIDWKVAEKNLEAALRLTPLQVA